jgi:hypothetical protein
MIIENDLQRDTTPEIVKKVICKMAGIIEVVKQN